MDRLAAYFQSVSGDTNKVFSELNEQGTPADGSTGSTLPQEICSGGGVLTCIEDNQIVVDSNPQNLGKNGSEFLLTTKKKPFLPVLIQELRKNPKNENVVTYAMIPTTIPNPDDNSKTLTEKFVIVAKGRKSLLGETLDKKHHKKFVCYVAYPVK